MNEAERRKQVNELIAEHMKRIEQKLEQLQHALVARWLIAILGLLIALGGVSYTLAQTTNTAKTAKAATAAIATQRYQSCVSQNTRRANTLKRLQIANQDALTPKSLKRLQNELAAIGIHVTLQSARKFQQLATSQNTETAALVNALVPQQNCTKFAMVLKKAGAPTSSTTDTTKPGNSR